MPHLIFQTAPFYKSAHNNSLEYENRVKGANNFLSCLLISADYITANTSYYPDEDSLTNYA